MKSQTLNIMKKNNPNFKMEHNIQKVVEGAKNKVGFYKFNKVFIEEFFLKDKAMLEANIYAHRILANVGLSLKSEQFYDANENFQLKLDLFDEEFMTEDNSGILFKMNSVEICKGANYESLQNALNFLESYQRGWYDSINLKGQTIRSLGGLISSAAFNKQTGNFQFVITGHWLKKLLHLTEYNQTYYRVVHELSSNKHMLFWYWLTILPEDGTQVNYKNLNERFDLGYKSARDLCKDFLRQIKEKFDQLAHVSFNFSYKGDIIKIAKYRKSPDEFRVENPMSETTYEVLAKRYKIGYVAKRHKLDKVHKTALAQLQKNEPKIFTEGYSLFIKHCRKNKIAATTFVGKDFIKEFQENIKEAFRDTSTGKRYPDSYPIIVV